MKKTILGLSMLISMYQSVISQKPYYKGTTALGDTIELYCESIYPSVMVDYNQPLDDVFALTKLTLLYAFSIDPEYSTVLPQQRVDISSYRLVCKDRVVQVTSDDIQGVFGNDLMPASVRDVMYLILQLQRNGTTFSESKSCFALVDVVQQHKVYVKGKKASFGNEPFFFGYVIGSSGVISTTGTTTFSYGMHVLMVKAPKL